MVTRADAVPVRLVSRVAHPSKNRNAALSAKGFDGAIKSMKIEIWSLDCSRHYEKNAREILQKACLETGGTFDSVAPGCRVAA